jgi:magnesium-transporting ATPase (P-type)
MLEAHEFRERPWHSAAGKEVVSDLETDSERGLSSREAEGRLKLYGPNRIRTGEMKPWYLILLHQFTDPLIYILLLAAVVSLLFDEIVDAAVILAVVVINGTIGFIQEYRARKSIRSLAEMSAPKARIIRDGKEVEIPSEEIVPGDIVLLAAGGRVPADVRILKVSELQTDESALTGEAETVSKRVEPVEDVNAVPGDQLNIAFSGTNITRGRGRGVAVRTGDASELGHIARETQEMLEVKTPIQEKMDRLGKAIGFAVILLALVVVFGGVLAGMELGEIVRTAVALAVGAVPEALPIVLTVTLAIGVQRMAGRNAIIRRLPAVETLGSTTVIGSDKTGTLTKNEMTVKVVWAGRLRHEVTGSGYDPEGEIKPAESEAGEGVTEAVRRTLLAGLLANETERLPAEGGSGDPTEIALLVSAIKGGFDPQKTGREYESLDMIPFESDRQFMATLNRTPEGTAVFLKGAPEAVLSMCSRELDPEGKERELDLEGAREMAGSLADEGYRVLGMAFRLDSMENFQDSDPGEELVFAGFQAMEDPVRPEAVEAVQEAGQAGVRVIMLTGDHARTAKAIGRQLGLCEERYVDCQAVEGRTIEERPEEELDRIVSEVNVFARVSPDHKLLLVRRLKAQGHIVAVTGDGVNDAPALQAAHLGVAMGRTGTDVAREASDMVLADDNFASITNAIEEGRVVFLNIRKVTYFLLSTGVGLVLTILSSLFGGWPLPYVAAQVLWINLVTKGLQDVSLAFEPGEPGLLREPPRDPREGVINGPVLQRMIWLGLFMAVGTMGVFWWILRQDVSLEMARSVAMTQMVMFQFFHVFNCRSMHRSLLSINPFGNPYVLGSVTLALLAHLAILHVDWLQAVFDTEPIPLWVWGIIVAVSLTILLVAEIDKIFVRRRRARSMEPKGRVLEEAGEWEDQ